MGESTQTHTGSLRSGRETIMNLFLLPGVCSDACGSPDGSHVDAMVSIRQISAWPHTPKKPPPSACEQASHEGLDGPTGREKLLANVAGRDRK